MRLIDINKTCAINPEMVSMVRRTSHGIGCDIIMVGSNMTSIHCDYPYEYACKLLATETVLGDKYEKWKPGKKDED